MGWVGPVSVWTGSPVVTGVGVTAEPSAPDVTVAEGSTERWIPPPTSPPAESAVAGELAMASVMKMTNDGKVAAKAILIIVAKSGFLTGEKACERCSPEEAPRSFALGMVTLADFTGGYLGEGTNRVSRRQTQSQALRLKICEEKAQGERHRRRTQGPTCP